MTPLFSQVLAQQTKKYNTSGSAITEQSRPTNNQFVIKPQSTIQFAKATQKK